MQKGNGQNGRIIIGINAVCEAIKSGKYIDKILVSDNIKGKIYNCLHNYGSDANSVTIKITDRKKLDFMFPNNNHQGVVAYLSEYKYSDIEDIFENARKKHENEFILIADSIEDPHNLGAIIRTAECMGVHGIIIPQRNSVGLNFTVSKTSAGAVEHIPVVKVKNLSRTLDMLKENGIWIYCSDMSGQNLYKTNFYNKVAIIVGNEGKGVSHLLKNKSDFVLSIPLRGKIESLNASVAAGIMMSECARQRYIHLS